MADKEYSRQRDKLWEKTKKAPFVPIGILGTLGMIAYGIKDYKNRGTMSTSVYVMQYRVKAQSMVVGAMTLGVIYHMIKENFLSKDTTAVEKK